MNRFIIILFFCTNIVSIYGQSWESLCGGVGYYGVRSIYADSLDNFLYVSGRFADVSGLQIKGIARWDGVQWDSLSAGLDGLDTINQFGGFANDMVRFDNKLYISGSFTSLGNIAARDIGFWDGNSWDTLSVQPHLSGISFIGAMTTINNELYVGGEFDTIAGISSICTAKWNGSTWSSLSFPNFFPNQTSINAICEYGGRVYVSGLIYSGAIDTVGHIMQYDGTSWSSVGGGIKGTGITSVSCMAVYNGDLYVGGYFSKSAGNAGNNIQKWNGTSWSDVGGGTDVPNGNVRKLIVWNGKLYAVGVFETAGGVPASKIAVWDGIKWCGLGSTFDNSISTVAIFHDSLYVGGGFWTIDGDTMNFISKWTNDNYLDTCSSIEIFEENKNDVYFNIYPNPVIDHFLITLQSPLTQESQIIIRDYLFREVNKDVLPKQSIYKRFDVSKISRGIYFLTIQNKNVTMNCRFVKQ